MNLPFSVVSYASGGKKWPHHRRKKHCLSWDPFDVCLFVCFLVVLKCFWWYTNFLTVSECFLQILWRRVVENMGSWARSQKSGVGLTGLLPVVRCETQLAALVAKMVAAILGKTLAIDGAAIVIWCDLCLWLDNIGWFGVENVLGLSTSQHHLPSRASDLVTNPIDMEVPASSPELISFWSGIPLTSSMAKLFS